ncbi:uncharacterized protein LOC122921446 [Bufo gargarizans]|uniref:uncharacterized protein LOC122921446 n=1 Tax=Bufo gargarizans TaxID=30331 RepID=UPI001CF37421|nr:uncharacterized protein LOC122921446 [Bufo gargarizans]
MGVVYILLLIQGITGEMVLYQPQDIVSVEVNRTAVITCVSSAKSIVQKFSWYRKSNKDLVRVKSCTRDNDPHKYGCKNENYTASLEIYNVQITNSGVYYCMNYYTRFSLKFGNGTYLNVGDNSTSRSSIHILGHLYPLHPNSSLDLTCVVLVAHNTVHLHWNISGTYYKGRIICKEESDGTWTLMNFISLPKNSWRHGEKMTCEVWINSSPTSVHWEIPEKDELNGYAYNCQSFLIPVVTSGTLLLFMLSVHLIRTLKPIGNKTQELTARNNMMEDEIVYSELNINQFSKFKNQPEE